MLNILIGACIAVTYAVVGLFSLLYLLVFFPSFCRKIAEKKKTVVFEWPLILSFFLFLTAVFFAAWFKEEKVWALYGLYSFAVLAGTNILSGIYEIGRRWNRNKEAGEVKVKKDAMNG